MAHIHCRVEVDHQNKQASFIWAEGPASFDPYHLQGMGFRNFVKQADKARMKLQELVDHHLEHDLATNIVVRQCLYELAEVGRNLHACIFPAEASDVQEWLAEIGVESLELVLDGPRLVPWNVVYMQDPDRDAFLADTNPNPCWDHFWGICYNLACSRKVDPLRRRNLTPERILLVLDPTVRQELDEPSQHALDEFISQDSVHVVDSEGALRQALREGHPDVMYWLCHASPEGLVLNDMEISPDELHLALQRAEQPGKHGGLAFLNACQTAQESRSGGSFMEAVHEVGVKGLVATEELTIDRFANQIGLEFLTAFCRDGQPVGETLHGLRRKHFPLGLLYTGYCPPQLRIQNESTKRSETHESMAAVPGRTLEMHVGGPSELPLPERPYPSLGYYDRDCRALFVGRDADTQRFAALLDDTHTRILVLHGESGVGKSSFLRAGVIPYL